MGGPNILFQIASFAFIAILTAAGPLLVYAQENPFQVGSDANPFEVGQSSATASGNSNTTLQIRSNTDWSGTYGDSTGSTTVDGHGNKDFIFSCSNTYSADFQKKGEGQGYLRLNIVQQETQSVSTPAELLPAKSYPSIEPGKSVNLTRHITDLVDPIGFDIIQMASSGKNGAELLDQPFNTTLLVTIKDPNGKTMIRNDTSGILQQPFSPTDSLSPPLKPDIAGNYIFTIKNIGDNPIDLFVDYGSSAPFTTDVTTNNMTNTRTTTAQFGTVSVSGSC